MGTIYFLLQLIKCLLQTERICRHSVTNNTCSSEGHIPGLTPGGGTTENILTHVCVSVFSFGGLAERLGERLQSAFTSVQI